MSTMPDFVLREKGFRVLQEHLGLVEAERFIALVSRESRFDYTQWRQEGLSDDPDGVRALSAKMMEEYRQLYGESVDANG